MFFQHQPQQFPNIKSILCVCSREEVHQVYDTPLLELVFRAATVHRMYNDPRMVSSCPPF